MGQVNEVQFLQQRRAGRTHIGDFIYEATEAELWCVSPFLPKAVCPPVCCLPRVGVWKGAGPGGGKPHARPVAREHLSAGRLLIFFGAGTIIWWSKHRTPPSRMGRNIGEQISCSRQPHSNGSARRRRPSPGKEEDSLGGFQREFLASLRSLREPHASGLLLPLDILWWQWTCKRHRTGAACTMSGGRRVTAHHQPVISNLQPTPPPVPLLGLSTHLMC